MRRDTRQRKRALAGWRTISGQDEMLGTLVRFGDLPPDRLRQ